MQQARLTASYQNSFQESLLNRPVSELTFVAFDTEATGRHPIISGLVEIAGVKFRGSGELLESRTQLINPGRLIPLEVTAVHGITDEMVASQPGVADVVPAFVEWMCAVNGGIRDDSNLNVLIAHNATFDVSFLQVALTRLGLPLPPNPVLDTLKLSRNYVQESRNHRLKTLVEYFGQGEDVSYHRAEADSRHVMHVFMELLKRAGSSCTLADLITAGGVLFFSKPFDEIENHRQASDLKVQRIGEAIECGADLQIHYRGQGIKIRRITPHSVLYSGRRYYLSAFCHVVANERTFRVERISSLELVERSGLGELK